MRLFFASDLHGSEPCFKKFVNAAKFYDASVLVLDGDLAGKNAGAEQAKRELAQAEKEIANIMAAIKQGILTPTTKQELETAEAKKAKLERNLKTSDVGVEGIEIVLPRLVDHYREIVEQLEQKTVEYRKVTKTRNCIKALVGGDILLVPNPEGGLNAELQGDYAGLLALAEKRPGTKGTGAGRKSKFAMVAGAGFVEGPTNQELRKVV